MTKLSSFLKSDRPFVIAEIGNNHEGDFGVARELIYAAKDAGVDAVKFQAITPENLISPESIARIKQLSKFCLSLDQFSDLSDLSSELGLVFFSSVFDIDLVDPLHEIQPLFKVSSGDNTYDDLIDKVVSTGAPTIISTGGLMLADIQRLRETVEIAGGKMSELALLHCISNYPTIPENAQLSMIEDLRQRFPDNVIGYSDHTDGILACCLAAGFGAQILEKHFTLSQTYSDFRDHSLSANPEQMSELMRTLPQVTSMVARGTEYSYRSDAGMVGVRRCAVAKRTIEIGEILGIDNVNWLRVASDAEIVNRTQVYGFAARCKIGRNQPIRTADIDC